MGFVTGFSHEGCAESLALVECAGAGWVVGLPCAFFVWGG